MKLRQSGTGASANEQYSSSCSKALRAAMGFSFYSTGGDKRPKECWNESHTINGSAPAAITKEKPAGVNRPRQRPVIGNAAASDRWVETWGAGMS
jgi:hypothetical protein